MLIRTLRARAGQGIAEPLPSVRHDGIEVRRRAELALRELELHEHERPRFARETSRHRERHRLRMRLRVEAPGDLRVETIRELVALRKRDVGRDRYKYYRDRGYPLHHHELDQWEER